MNMNVVFGWALRLSMIIGGGVGTLITTYASLDPATQALIGGIAAGEWRSIPFGQVITGAIAIWGLTASWRNTVPSKNGSRPVVAHKPKTLLEHLGFFGK